MISLRLFPLWAGAFALLCGAGARAQQIVHFPSLDASATVLDGYLFRPVGDGRHPALVFLHGCTGLISRTTGRIASRESDWAARRRRA